MGNLGDNVLNVKEIMEPRGERAHTAAEIFVARHCRDHLESENSMSTELQSSTVTLGQRKRSSDSEWIKKTGIEVVKEETMMRTYGNNREFKENFDQTKTIAPNNHAKVFDVKNGVVEIGEPVGGMSKNIKTTVSDSPVGGRLSPQIITKAPYLNAPFAGHWRERAFPRSHALGGPASRRAASPHVLRNHDND